MSMPLLKIIMGKTSKQSSGKFIISNLFQANHLKDSFNCQGSILEFKTIFISIK